MKIFILVLLVAGVTLATGSPAINKPPKASADSRVFNGIPAVDGQFPYQVLIENKALNGNTFYCGGVLIGSSWVLTTAHCVRIAKTIRVYLGSVYYPNSTMIVTSNTFTRHAGYDSSESRNDIGIIALPVIISETEYIKVIKFAKQSDEIFDGEKAIVSGFGNKTHARDILTYGEAKIISNSECQRYYSSPMIHSRICTFAHPKPEQQPCKDYGSPLVVYRDNKPLLVGLVNMNIACLISSNDRPTGYTRVSSFADWITEKSGIV